MNDAQSWAILVSMSAPYVYILVNGDHAGNDFTNVLMAQVIVFFLAYFILKPYF